MKWAAKPPPSEETDAERQWRLRQWRPWFAWHPVKCGDTWVWLETVERSGHEETRHSGGAIDGCSYAVVVWTYRTPEEA